MSGTEHTVEICRFIRGECTDDVLSCLVLITVARGAFGPMVSADFAEVGRTADGAEVDLNSDEINQLRDRAADIEVGARTDAREAWADRGGW